MGACGSTCASAFEKEREKHEKEREKLETLEAKVRDESKFEAANAKVASLELTIARAQVRITELQPSRDKAQAMTPDANAIPVGSGLGSGPMGNLTKEEREAAAETEAELMKLAADQRELTAAEEELQELEKQLADARALRQELQASPAAEAPAPVQSL